jgi:hypothetical protein
MMLDPYSIHYNVLNDKHEKRIKYEFGDRVTDDLALRGLCTQGRELYKNDKNVCAHALLLNGIT